MAKSKYRKEFLVTTTYNGIINGIDKKQETLTTMQLLKLITYTNNTNKVRSISITKIQ